MNRNKISVTIITLNEENNIERCMKSVKSFADEVIVVDSGSTDKTVDIAKKLGAKIFVRKFDDYSNQKNFAASKTVGEWVFSLDADEVAAEQLSEEVKSAVKVKDYNAYLIPRRNFILRAEIKYTRFSPDKHIWLWKKEKGKWVGKVHEEVKVDGWVGELKNAKIHYQYETVGEFLSMMNKYTERMADEAIEKGSRFSLLRLFFAPTLSFFRRFFYKKGFLDGWRGFFLSYLMAIYRMTTWIKIWEKTMRNRSSPSGLLKKAYIVFLILVVALILRLLVINQSLWLDESIGAYAVKNFTYKGILTHFIASDFHPPLYYLTLKSWTVLFGYSEVALRFPSIIFGILTVYLTYLIAGKISDNKFFQMAALVLITTSPFHIYYSQEARMYSMAAFFAALSIYSFINLLDNTKASLAYWFIFSLSIVWLIFTDYMPIFLFPVFWTAALIRRKNFNWWIKFFFTHVPVLIFGILWLPTLMKQLAGSRWLLSTLPAWKVVAGGATIKQLGLVWAKFTLGRLSLTDKFLYYTLITLASIPFMVGLTNAVKKREIITNIITMWLVLPLVIGFIASIWFPAFVYFRFLYIIPAFYLLVSWGVSNSRSPIFTRIIFIFLLLVNIFGLSIYYFDKNQHRENWREAVDFVDKVGKNNEAIIFEYPEVFTPYKWYTKGKILAVGATDSLSPNSDMISQRMNRVLQGKTGVYYFEYLRDLSDPKHYVESTLNEYGYSVKKIYSFNGVGQVYYWTKSKI